VSQGVPVDELLKKPGPLWQMVMTVKEVDEKGKVMFFLVGLETNRPGITREHATEVLKLGQKFLEQNRWIKLDSGPAKSS
jgi:hypothetical protein